MTPISGGDIVSTSEINLLGSNFLLLFSFIICTFSILCSDEVRRLRRESGRDKSEKSVKDTEEGIDESKHETSNKI